MNRTILAFSFVCALAASAYGQYAPGQYDRPYGDRDYARQDRSVFDRARMDLDRANAYPYASRADRRRFDEARRDLFDFASRFDQGRYEKHELDGAIDHLQRVVSSNSLDPRDRGALSEDLRRMRDYREFRNHHGERDFGYGYQR
ncbi:MAG TPA: hypothetical protein VHZ74_00775 [Bryobacteraceae bacterium]|nr:hypothetical protein [Bryobacteraceae bacterium]